MGTNNKLCCNDLLAPRYKLQPVMDSIYIAEGQNLNFGSVVDCKGFLCDSTHLEPYAILYEDCDTTNGAKEANVLIMGEFNIEKLVFGADATGDVLDKIVFYAKKNGIIIRPYDYALSFTPPEVSSIEKVIPEGTNADNKLVDQATLDEATAAWDAGYTPKGPASVSTLNGLSGQENGDRYVLTDEGTLSSGSVVVAAGDEVVWDATNEVWYKVNQYALAQFGTNKIKDLTNTATESDLVLGNYFALDGSAGTKKLNIPTLFSVSRIPKNWGTIPAGGTLAYLAENAGGHLKWSYRFGVSNKIVVGTAMATFTSSGNNPNYVHIDYIQNPKGVSFPFRMETDGTRHRIVSTATSAMEISTVFCAGNWIYNESWSNPPSWNSSNVTTEGVINNAMDLDYQDVRQNVLSGTTAPEFDATKSNYSGKSYAYAVGEKVVYSGELYRFKAPHSGAWNSAHVTKINVVSLTSQDFLNGGLGNTGNVNKVRTVAMPFNLSGQRVRIRITRPVSASGNYYEMYGRVADSYDAIGSDLASGTYSPYQVIEAKKEGEEFVINAPNAKVVAFEIAEYDSSRNPVPLRFFDFEGWNAFIETCPSNDKTLDYSLLNAIARFGVASNTSKDFCALIVTDSHNDNKSVQRAIKYSGEAVSASALVHCGDYAGSYITYNQSTTDWAQSVSSSTKPTFFVMGNHEKGSFANIKLTPTDETLYNLFVKPIVDKGYLSVGEYEENKCYYYHDFTSLKVRLIVLDEYRAPTDYLETYWSAIEYDSTLPDVADNTNYSAGDKVNVPGFTLNSFQAVQSVNTGTYYSGKQPCYKCIRGWRYIDQTEAQWFLNTLYSTPSNYIVVVSMHFPFSDLAVPDKTKKFCQQVNIGNTVTGADWSSNYMATDFVASALNAFKTGTSYSATISTKQESDAAYISDYSVSKDFSVRGAGKLGLIIGGHVHRDVVWKHPTYTYMYQVTPMCSNTTSSDNNRNADIRLQNDNQTLDFIDSLTAFAVADGRAALAKIGCKYTIDALCRDIEVL